MIALPTDIVFRPHHAELQFDEERHLYCLKGGEVLSSVTSILKAEGIQQYGPRNADADFRMQVGTWVHQAIAWYEHGTLDEGSLSGGIRPYVESYKKFRTITGFRPILPIIEIPMWHPNWRFSGTPDLPGTIAGRFVLVDLKSGEKRAGDMIQVAAYGDLVVNSVLGFENIYPEGCVVYLQSDGSMPKLEKVRAEDMHRNKDLFLAALKVNRWKSAHNLGGE